MSKCPRCLVKSFSLSTISRAMISSPPRFQPLEWQFVVGRDGHRRAPGPSTVRARQHRRHRQRWCWNFRGDLPDIHRFGRAVLPVAAAHNRHLSGVSRNRPATDAACGIHAISIAADHGLWHTRNNRFRSLAEVVEAGVWQSSDQKTGIRRRTGFEASASISTAGHECREETIGTAERRHLWRRVSPEPNGSAFHR
jgi:hypothetical protein